MSWHFSCLFLFNNSDIMIFDIYIQHFPFAPVNYKNRTVRNSIVYFFCYRLVLIWPLQICCLPLTNYINLLLNINLLINPKIPTQQSVCYSQRHLKVYMLLSFSILFGFCKLINNCIVINIFESGWTLYSLSKPVWNTYRANWMSDQDLYRNKSCFCFFAIPNQLLWNYVHTCLYSTFKPLELHYLLTVFIALLQKLLLYPLVSYEYRNTIEEVWAAENIETSISFFFCYFICLMTMSLFQWLPSYIKIHFLVSYSY